MNIENAKKIKSLQEGYEYFFKGNNHKLIDNIIKELCKIKNNFDLEFCLFYKKNILQNKFKFAFFLEKGDLKYFLKLIKDIKINFNCNEIKGIQITFNNNIIESYSVIYIRYIKDDLTDISVKYTKINKFFVKNIREYKHIFPINYINNKKIASFLGLNIIDIIKIKKVFLGQCQDSYYFMLEKGLYSTNNIEKVFNVMIPEYVKIMIKSPFCICIGKSDYYNKNYDSISVYFGTYGLGK